MKVNSFTMALIQMNNVSAKNILVKPPLSAVLILDKKILIGQGSNKEG